jgi:protein-disulfide isomerase
MAEKNKQKNKFFYFISGLNIVALILFLFLFQQIKKIDQRVANIEKLINPQQQAPQKEVTLDTIKKLFGKDFIHFGDAKKKLLIVEVSDPSCPFCHIAGGENPELASQSGDRFKYQSDGGSYIPPVPEIRKLVNDGKASFAFIYSNGHGNGRIATEALYCAYEKGKFWEVHDKLMTNAGYNLINEQVKNDRSKAQELANFVADVIDPQFLSNCLSSAKYEKNLTRDEQISPSLGFQGTPHFVINTKLFQGAYSFSEMKSDIDKYL